MNSHLSWLAFVFALISGKSELIVIGYCGQSSLRRAAGENTTRHLPFLHPEPIYLFPRRRSRPPRRRSDRLGRSGRGAVPRTCCGVSAFRALPTANEMNGQLLGGGRRARRSLTLARLRRADATKSFCLFALPLPVINSCVLYASSGHFFRRGSGGSFTGPAFTVSFAMPIDPERGKREKHVRYWSANWCKWPINVILDNEFSFDGVEVRIERSNFEQAEFSCMENVENETKVKRKSKMKRV